VAARVWNTLPVGSFQMVDRGSRALYLEPGAIKLLLCAERALQTFASYKANRNLFNSDRTP